MYKPVSRTLNLLGAAVICGVVGVSCVQSPAPSASEAASPTPIAAALATPSQPQVQQTSLGDAAATPTVAASPVGAAAGGVGVESAVAAIYNQVSPAIVQVLVQGASQTTPFGQVPQSGEGSGIVVDNKGDILTNYHVVADAQAIQVTLADGTSLDARLLGSDPGDDLAVINVDLSQPGAASAKLAAATLGDSDQVKPGQIAIAIGNPFGLDDTLTVGFISAVNRTRDEGADSRPIRGIIQTDAAINPGNSGGALVNSKGEVIGITSSIDSPVEGSVGVGFAIPINTAKAVLQRMIDGQTIQHAYLGITSQDLTPMLAQQLGLSTTQGVYVIHVAAGSPAEKAGLKGAVATTTNQRRTPWLQVTPQASSSLAKGGDVITAIDGKQVVSSDDISAYLDSKQVGDTVTLSIVRDGTARTLTATLAAWPTS